MSSVQGGGGGGNSANNTLSSSSSKKHELLSSFKDFSKKSTLGKSSNSSNLAGLSGLASSSSIMLIKVIFLDNSVQMIKLDRKKSKGIHLLERVFNHLELIGDERRYFGLVFHENTDENCSHQPSFNPELMRWIDPLKLLRKQLKKNMKHHHSNNQTPQLVYFRVKFYVTDPSQLKEEFTRYQVYLQVKRDLLESRLSVPPSTLCLLISYIVQSTMGDYDPNACYDESYLSRFLDLKKLFMDVLESYKGSTHSLNNLIINHKTDNGEFELHVAELHKLHQGQSPTDAEFNFLEHAKCLELYGINSYHGKDSNGRDIELGVTCVGLVVIQNRLKINTFSWSKIVKISYKRKQFFIKLRKELTDNCDTLLGFNLTSYRSCKNLWKSAVEHHSFFQLYGSSGIKKSSSSSSILDASSYHPHQVTTPSTLQTIPKRFLMTLGSHFRPSARTDLLKMTNLTSTTPSQNKNSPFSRSMRCTLPINLEASPAQQSNSRVPKLASPETSSIGSSMHSSNSLKIKPGASMLIESCSSKTLASGTTLAHRAIETFNNHIRSLSTKLSKKAWQKTFLSHDDGGFLQKRNSKLSARLSKTNSVTNSPATRNIHHPSLELSNLDVYFGEDVEEPEFRYVPEAPHLASTSFVHSTKEAILSQSMLLLEESLESGAIIGQFEQLYRRNTNLAITECHKTSNTIKNRYRDILPYDTTRVIIKSGPSGDYINANHVVMNIPGSGIINRYIATQGPLGCTCEDFWYMIWDTQSSLIIMLTTIVEHGRIKCHKYWPDLDDTLKYEGGLKVTCVKEVDDYTNFAFRDFMITNGDEIRSITQMAYLSWPDHGVPDSSEEFVEFVEAVQSHRQATINPTVVHCSAGIGRTGVLILMETAINLIEANQPVYPLNLTRVMRDQRASMIQTPSQYKFVCKAILDVYKEGKVKPLPEFCTQ